MNGKFEATGKIATLVAKVFQDTIDVSRHFEIPQVDLTSRPKELDLSGRLSLKARESAAAGTYRLEVVVMDTDDYSVKAVTGFQVLPAADTVGPIIQILSPTTGTVLENDVSTVAVKAQVEDPSGVDSVWIADKLAVGESGVWSVESVEIPVTDIGFAVVVRAKDAKGNASSKDVLVGRKAKLDPGSPTWSVLSPKANELFPFDSAATSVLWKVSDPRAEVVKAWIGGGEASKESDGIWTRRVDLPATGSLTTVTLLAVNANNDTIKGFVQVTRQADTKGPMIQIKSPVDGTVFAYDAQSVLVKVAATDPSGIDSVKIDGKPAESVGTEYAYSMALEPGKEAVIRVQAWDKLKNSAVESLTVTRKGPPDTTAPRLKLLGPASGTELSLETKAATLRWLVTDLFGLVDADVKIDGKVAQRSADTFSLVVAAPAPGGEESHRIDVKNVKGVSNFETMTLKRAKDAVAPKLLRVDSGRTVAFETEKAAVSWKVSDNYLLGSVSIAGKVVTGVNGLYSQEVALATGDNRVAIVATDSANNSSTDTVIVHRTWKDTSKPLVIRQSGTEPKNVPFATTEFTASWKVTDNALLTVTINGVVITSTDGIYSLKVTLAGTQTPIKIVAKDAADNSKVDSITITKSDDLIDPVVARLPGTKDTTVPYATSTYALGWEVIDESGVASVSVSGVPATKSGDNYRLTVSLPKVGLNEFLMVAKDVAGNESYDTIRIRRAYHDSIAPQRVRGANTKDTTVPYGTAKYTLSWTVTDNDVVKSVTIGGGVASFSQGVYSREVNLVAGPNKFGMLATDTAGNNATDTVTITVAADGAAPKITREAGTKDSAVAYGVTSITLKWTITDDVGVTSVTVNGVTVQATTSGVYSHALTSLKFGANGVKVVAKDAAGKTSTDTLTITRKNDVLAPSIVRQSGTKDSAVAYEKTTHSLSWKITDDNGLASVKVNGTTLQSSSGIYTFPISGLVIGTNGFKLIATDIAGKTSSDSVTITRTWKDTIAPVVTRQTGTGPQTVPNGTASLTVSWKVTDTLLQAVTIQGTAKTGVSDIYSASISLAVGNNKISLVATDKQGNVTKDEFVVIRSAPAPIHSLASSRYIGTAYDSLQSTGSDSIQYSTDGTIWKKAVGGIAAITGSGDITVFAKAWPGGAVSSIKIHLSQIKTVAAGNGSTWFLMQDGTVWAVGFNGEGRLGTGSTLDERSPVLVASDVKSVVAGLSHALVLKNDGTVWASGSNYFGQLGLGYKSKGLLVFTKVMSGISDIEAGDYSSFFIKPDGTVLSCGANTNGELAKGYTSEYDSIPTPSVFSGAIQISAWSGPMFVTKNRSIQSAGSNYQGQLGMGDVVKDSLPREVWLDGIQVSTNNNHSLIVSSDRTVWGMGNQTCFGVNGPEYYLRTPTKIESISNIDVASAGQYHSLFLSRTGVLYFAGLLVTDYPRGPSGKSFATPAQILNNVSSAFAGSDFSFAVKTDGTVWAFGWNGNCAFGIDGIEATETPVQINF